jgi:hypothetical protein
MGVNAMVTTTRRDLLLGLSVGIGAAGSVSEVKGSPSGYRTTPRWWLEKVGQSVLGGQSDEFAEGAVREDGRYAALQILGYYCAEARPGCLTFRYVYQGASDSREVRSPSSAPPR